VGDIERARSPRGVLAPRRWWWSVAIGVIALLLFLLLRGPLADLWQTRARIRELESAANGGSAAGESKASSDAPLEAHPLDPALELARRALDHVHANVADYTAVIVKRERIGNELAPEQRFRVKIRNRRVSEDGSSVPLSVYLDFQAPPSIQGREVIWVEDRNDGKMIAHEGGLLGVVRLELDPLGLLAMKGNRYPIHEIGIERLLEKLCEVGESDRAQGECEVTLDRGAEVDGVPCTRIEIRHPRRREHFAFHVAEICIDEARLVPLRFASWDWPDDPEEPPILVEDYVYEDLRLNPGLTDADFDPGNPDYDFP